MKIYFTVFALCSMVAVSAQKIHLGDFYRAHVADDSKAGGKGAFEEALYALDSVPITVPSFIRDSVTQKLRFNDIKALYQRKYLSLIDGMLLIWSMVTKAERYQPTQLIRKAVSDDERDNLFIIEAGTSIYGVLVTFKYDKKSRSYRWKLRPINEIPSWYWGKQSITSGSQIFCAWK
jgi:hypothetical protein